MCETKKHIFLQNGSTTFPGISLHVMAHPAKNLEVLMLQKRILSLQNAEKTLLDNPIELV